MNFVAPDSFSKFQTDVNAKGSTISLIQNFSTEVTASEFLENFKRIPKPSVFSGQITNNFQRRRFWILFFDNGQK